MRESFDLHDKVHKYDDYAATGKALEDEDIDILEDALDALDGAGIFKQSKATLQMNKAKKALIYNIKTAKK